MENKEKTVKRKEKIKNAVLNKTAKVEYELILAIVNRGFSEEVMDTAVKNGATGGTSLHGRGTYKTTQTVLGMRIEPEKEIVMIVADKKICAQIITAVYQCLGLHTPGSGICFALPISEVVGLRNHTGGIINKADIKDKPDEEKNKVDETKDKADGLENKNEK